MRRIMCLLAIVSVFAFVGCTQPKAPTSAVKPNATGEGQVVIAGNKSTKPVPTPPAENKPAESKPGEKPAEKPAESKPGETKPGDKTPPAPPK